MENRLFQIHHKIYLKLNAICQEAGDMDVEEFLEVYENLKNKSQKYKTSIERRFQEDAINDMDMDTIVLKLLFNQAGDIMALSRDGQLKCYQNVGLYLSPSLKYSCR